MARYDLLLGQSFGTLQSSGGGTLYLVESNTGNLYSFYVDSGSDLVYRKSTDNGISWSDPITVFAGTIIAMAVWYDRWSGISGDLVHIAYSESATDDILYRSLDVSSDTLGTQTTVFAGTGTAAGGALSITRARGGNLVVAGSIDAGSEDGAWKSTDVGATWGATIADPSEAATQDQYLLLPGWNADTQDVQLIFWDASANELSVKRYDDSANSWTETSIATGMTDTPASSQFPHLAAVVDLTNSQNILIAWNAVDTANADLQCWTLNDTTITAKTDVVTNSTDDQGLAGLTLDTSTGNLYAVYGGKSDGTETFPTAINFYYKLSTNGGTTWGSETKLTNQAWNSKWLGVIPRISAPGKFIIAFSQDIAFDEIRVNVDISTGGGGGGIGRITIS